MARKKATRPAGERSTARGPRNNGEGKKRRMPRREPKVPDRAPQDTKAPPAPSGTGPLPGEEAPDFTLEATTGSRLTLSDLRGHKAVVLFFFPRAGTPGCTLEAQEFRDEYRRIRTQGAQVIGISPDSLAKLRRFAGTHGLRYPLLSDPTCRVASAYGAYGMKSLMGRSFKGVIRSTFLVNRRGVIVRSWNRVKVKGHAADVARALEKG